MTKKLAITMLVGLQLVGATAAFADPIEFSGDTSLKYEKDTQEGTSDKSGVMSTIKLNMNADLGSGWGAYARLGFQNATNPDLADFNQEAYSQGKKRVAGIDLFGLNYQQDQLTYRLGRQDVTIGETSLLYSRSDSNIGKHQFVDGLSVNGKVGETDLAAIFAREDDVTSQKNRLYAIHAGWQASDHFSYGLTLGSYRYAEGDTTRHWAVDGVYKTGQHTLTMEYTRSNRSEQNKAYAGTWNYDFDDHTGMYVTAFRVEPNGDMGGQSDFDNGNKGMYYGVTHKFSDHDGLEFVYKDQKEIESGAKNTKLEATFTHSF